MKICASKIGGIAEANYNSANESMLATKSRLGEERAHPLLSEDVGQTTRGGLGRHLCKLHLDEAGRRLAGVGDRAHGGSGL